MAVRAVEMCISTMLQSIDCVSGPRYVAWHPCFTVEINNHGTEKLIFVGIGLQLDRSHGRNVPKAIYASFLNVEVSLLPT